MVHAEKIGQKGYKSDINVVIRVNIKKKYQNKTLETVENIQVKLVSNSRGYNQVEKKKVAQYKDVWHMPNKIKELLMLYDGECPPREGSRDAKRIIRLGNITLQRKGGDNGADSANMLQFKANPLILFEDK